MCIAPHRSTRARRTPRNTRWRYRHSQHLGMAHHRICKGPCGPARRHLRHHHRLPEWVGRPSLGFCSQVSLAGRAGQGRARPGELNGTRCHQAYFSLVGHHPGRWHNVRCAGTPYLAGLVRWSVDTPGPQIPGALHPERRSRWGSEPLPPAALSRKITAAVCTYTSMVPASDPSLPGAPGKGGGRTSYRRTGRCKWSATPGTRAPQVLSSPWPNGWPAVPPASLPQSSQLTRPSFVAQTACRPAARGATPERTRLAYLPADEPPQPCPLVLQRNFRPYHTNMRARTCNPRTAHHRPHSCRRGRPPCLYRPSERQECLLQVRPSCLVVWSWPGVKRVRKVTLSVPLLHETQGAGVRIQGDVPLTPGRLPDPSTRPQQLPKPPRGEADCPQLGRLLIAWLPHSS